MKQGRWIAVTVCSGLVALATGMLYIALSRDYTADQVIRYFPYFALAFIAITPLAAAGLSGSASWFAAGAGGLAIGIATTVVAAGLNSGGTGVMPLTLGVVVGGVIGLRADTHLAIWLRLIVAAALAVYAVASGRLVTLVFVYPLLGFADEFADAIVVRRNKTEREKEPASARS
jgi:hypothetical protein